MAEGFFDLRNRGVETNNVFTRPKFIQTKADKARLAIGTDKQTRLVSDKKDKIPPSQPKRSKFLSKPKPKLGEIPKVQPLIQKIFPKSVVVRDRDDSILKQIVPDEFKESPDDITLVGEYEKNQISFPKYTFEEIIASKEWNVSFQFVLKVIDNSGIRYFTSYDFKQKLLQTTNDNIPYLAVETLNPAAVVKIDLRPILNSLEEYSREEQKAGVLVDFNTFTDAAGTIDYQKLVEYIDWVVSKPPSNYEERFLSATYLGSWQIIDGVDYGEGVVPSGGGDATPSKQQSSAGTGVPNVTNPTTQDPPPIKKVPLKPEDTLIGGTIRESINNPDVIYPIATGVLVRNGEVQQSFTDSMTRGAVPFVNLPQLNFPPNRFTNGQLNFTDAEKNALQQGIADSLKGMSLVPEVQIPKLNLPNLTGVDWSKIDLSKINSGG